MKCTKCGKDNIENSNYCSGCGASLVESEIVATNNEKEGVRARYKVPLLITLIGLKIIQVVFAIIDISNYFYNSWNVPESLASDESRAISRVFATVSLPIIVLVTLPLMIIPFIVGLVLIISWSKKKERLSAGNIIAIIFIFILNIIPFAYLLCLCL